MRAVAQHQPREYVRSRKNNQTRFELTFKPTIVELQQYYSIRETCYKEVPNGPADFNGSEDHYDRASDILIIKSEQSVIGGARIYGYRVGFGEKLPLEEGFLLSELFPEKKLKNTPVCEFGRLAVLKPYRQPSLLKFVVDALLKQSIRREYRYLFSISPLQQARCYRLMVNALRFPYQYTIHNNIHLPQKSKSERGELNMVLSSLQLPHIEGGNKDHDYYDKSAALELAI